jgi:hypothetical protein
MKRFAMIAAGLLIGGCAYRPTPVPMSGDPAWIAALRGTWSGTYVGTESGRRGNITFTIRVHSDSAFGDVLMEAPPGLPVIQVADDPGAHRRHVASPHMLAMRFVQIASGEVEGALEPYAAPDCDCTVQTTFRGLVQGDTIRGTFVTRGRLIAAQTGVWAVARER